MEKSGGIRGWICGNLAAAGFYLYAILAAPPLARALKEGLARPEPLWGPGLLLLAILLVEPLGLRWKILFLRRRSQEENFEPQGSMLAVFSAAVIAHMIVTMFLGMLALDCWGVVGAGSENESTWWGAVIVALILKEFVEIFAGAGKSVAREAPGHWKERAAEVLMLAYGGVAYTAWWGALVDLEAISGAGFWEKLVLMPFLGGLFVFLYLPLRLPFLLEEYYLKPAQGRKGRVLAELAIGAALGLYPIFAPAL